MIIIFLTITALLLTGVAACAQLCTRRRLLTADSGEGCARKTGQKEISRAPKGDELAPGTNAGIPSPVVEQLRRTPS